MTPAALRARLAQAVSTFARAHGLQPDFREHGWNDFLAGDFPDTADPAELAAAALLHLAVDDGRFNGFGSAVLAIDAFLRLALGDRYPRSKARPAYEELRALLAAEPVDEGAVLRWHRDFLAGT